MAVSPDLAYAMSESTVMLSRRATISYVSPLTVYYRRSTL